MLKMHTGKLSTFGVGTAVASVLFLLGFFFKHTWLFLRELFLSYMLYNTN